MLDALELYELYSVLLNKTVIGFYAENNYQFTEF